MKRVWRQLCAFWVLSIVLMGAAFDRASEAVADSYVIEIPQSFFWYSADSSYRLVVYTGYSWSNSPATPARGELQVRTTSSDYKKVWENVMRCEDYPMVAVVSNHGSYVATIGNSRNRIVGEHIVSI